MPLRIGLIGTFPSAESGGSTGSGTNPVIITTTSLPSATIGVPYSATLTAIGGVPASPPPPYKWSVIAGALPTGLNLDIFGNITGTPSALGTFNFTVQAVDPAGNSGRVGIRYKL